MSALLTPVPELRVSATAPLVDEISPEAAVGRFEGHTDRPSATRQTPVFEQPWHAHAVKCLALKMSFEETARFCEVTPESVRLAMRMPVFQARLREALAASAAPLLDFFNDAGVKAFHKIVEIMDDPKTPKATALASAKEIIDRCLGKAPQTIKHGEADSVGDPVALVEHLRRENAGLRTQLPN